MMEVAVTTGLLEICVMQSFSQIITTNKPTSSFLQAGCPSCHPTNSVKALKALNIKLCIHIITVYRVCAPEHNYLCQNTYSQHVHVQPMLAGLCKNLCRNYVYFFQKSLSLLNHTHTFCFNDHFSR